MELTYFGHATFLVKVNGKSILFDPFITPNPLAKHIDITAIKPDYIFITHAHGDHIADAEAIAKSSGAMVISTYEVCNWLESKGVKKCHPLGIGGKKELDFGTVKMVTAQHSSSFPDGSYGGTATGFVIKSTENNFYFSGDTALTLDMELVPRFAKPGFAVLPIGDNFTMGYEDAAEAAVLVQTKKVVGVHYDTFGYIEIDKQKALECFKSKGIELLLPAIGETINL